VPTNNARYRDITGTFSDIRDSRLRLRHTRSSATWKLFAAIASRSRRVWQTTQCARIYVRRAQGKPHQQIAAALNQKVAELA
jgi:hypothetical protein